MSNIFCSVSNVFSIFVGSNRYVNKSSIIQNSFWLADGWAVDVLEKNNLVGSNFPRELNQSHQTQEIS